MRVLVNGMTAAGTRTGIGHYTGELLRSLRELAGADAIHCYQSAALSRAWQWGRRLRGQVSHPPATPAAPGFRSRLTDGLRRLGLAWYRWRFAAHSRRGQYDLYHEPAFLPLGCELPTVVTVHDLSVVLHPEWHPTDRVRHHQREFLRGLARCEHVLTVSDAARLEIIRTIGLPADRVTRVYNGIRRGLCSIPPGHLRPRQKQLGLPERYLLYLGTIEPRKNVLTLLRAYCALPVTVRLRYPLLLVGGWGWNSGDVAAYLDEAKDKGVHYLGYLPEEALPVLYNGARALVFPSRYEGFGLPPVEMLATGGAVLASNAAAIAETVGRKACLIDPDDEDGWRSAMLRVCEDDDWWLELRRDAADVARPFTWERCAAETLAVYERVVPGRQAAWTRAA